MKIEWKHERGVLSHLFIEGQNIIDPWGIETADSSAFFSLEEGFGYRYQLIEEAKKEIHQSYLHYLDIQMKEGRFSLEVEEKIIDQTVKRSVILSCLEDSYFMDFVMRFRFKKTFFPQAKINQKIYNHNNTNLYYQYPVLKAAVLGPKFDVNIDVQDYITSKKMTPCMYVRDAEDEWVVHARMIPKISDKEVIKLCNPYVQTRPIPQWLSRPLLKVPYIKNQLWYRGERAPFKGKIMRRINPLACPLVRLKKGQVLKWSVNAEFKSKT